MLSTFKVSCLVELLCKSGCMSSSDIQFMSY